MIAQLSRSLWLWGVVALIAATLTIGGYVVGHRHAANACAAEKLAAVERAIEQAQDIARQDAEVLANHVRVVEKIDMRYRTLKQEVVRYVEAHPSAVDCGLDADGLRLWNAANAGLGAADPGHSGERLPGAARRGVGATAGSGREPRGRDGALPQMPGELPRHDGADTRPASEMTGNG